MCVEDKHNVRNSHVLARQAQNWRPLQDALELYFLNQGSHSIVFTGSLYTAAALVHHTSELSKSHIVGVSSIGGELATPTRSPERDARQRYGPMQSHVLHGRVVARIDANEWSRLMMRWHIDDHNYHKNGTSARLREYARYCRVVLCEPTLSPALLTHDHCTLRLHSRTTHLKSFARLSWRLQHLTYCLQKQTQVPLELASPVLPLISLADQTSQLTGHLLNQILVFCSPLLCRRRFQIERCTVIRIISIALAIAVQLFQLLTTRSDDVCDLAVVRTPAIAEACRSDLQLRLALKPLT